MKVWNDFKKRPWRYDLPKALALTRRIFPNRRPRFVMPPTTSFRPGPVAGLKIDQGGNPALILNVAGLCGPNAPLPLHLTLLAEERAKRGEPELAEFFNLFNDRLVNLYQEIMSLMKPEGGAVFGKYALAAAGQLGRTPKLRLPIPTSGPQGVALGTVPEESFFAAAAVWGLFPRSASGLEFLVKKVFGIKAKVEPLKGAWTALPPEHRSQLGQRKNQLGIDTISGGHVFDPAAGFTLKLGPLTKEQYRDFLPPPAGSRYGQLMALVRAYCPETLYRLAY